MNSIVRKKIIQEYYSKRSKNYDRQKRRTWQTSQGFGIEVINELLDALTLFENKVVLEVGVGSGRNALTLMQKIKPEFVGLDLSKEMLKLAKTKMSSFKQNLDLILGDAEQLPFVNNAFDSIVCMSTMHYFESQEKMLKKFSAVLKEKGTFVYGDLTIHELDDQGFFETLERTLSKAHARYYKPSEMRKLMQTNGFRISKIKTVPYRKSYNSLMKDKGEYFDVTPEMLQEHIQRATLNEKEQYGLTATELTLYYTIISAIRAGA